MARRCVDERAYAGRGQTLGSFGRRDLLAVIVALDSEDFHDVRVVAQRALRTAPIAERCELQQRAAILARLFLRLAQPGAELIPREGLRVDLRARIDALDDADGE